MKECTLQEMLYADDIVLIAESMAELDYKIHSWKSALESKGLKENLVKTMVMVIKIGQIIVKTSSKKDQCGIYGRRTMLTAA